MREILVTGAAGFIGAKTAEMLLDTGNKVVGIDNLNDYYDVRVKLYRLSRLKDRVGFTFYQADIEDIHALEGLLKSHRIDAIVNLAARAGVRYSLINPYVYMTTNAIGTLNLLEMMRQYGIKKMVLASTSSLYAGHPMPFREDAPVNSPISPYGASKKAAESVAYSYHHLYGIDVTVLRYFTVYGPAGRPDMSPFRFIKWIDEGCRIELFGDGNQKRDFTYIDDIARGTIYGLKDLGFEVINLGGGVKPCSINAMIGKMEALLGKKAIIDYRPFHRADMTETGAEIAKAKRLLDWDPEVDFDRGLEETVRWHIDNRHWIRDITL